MANQDQRNQPGQPGSRTQQDQQNQKGQQPGQQQPGRGQVGNRPRQDERNNNIRKAWDKSTSGQQAVKVNEKIAAIAKPSTCRWSSVANDSFISRTVSQQLISTVIAEGNELFHSFLKPHVPASIQK
jgi:hypothetical protein